jgi:hypothetical protein
MMDIKTSVNFAVKYQYKFCFRNCSFRNADLTSWHKTSFIHLFDEENFEQITGYIPYDFADLKNQSIWNEKGEKVVNLIKSSKEINDHAKNYDFVVLYQFWGAFNWEWNNLIINPEIKPASKIYKKFLDITKTLPKKFNFLHYRFEHDFISHFTKKGAVFPELNDVINLKLFKDGDLPIYLATSSAAKIYSSKLSEKNKKIIFFKDETELQSFNFEELAFIDFMIGMMANEVFGHSRSSFSYLVNQHKNTKNFYDIIKK